MSRLLCAAMLLLAACAKVHPAQYERAAAACLPFGGLESMDISLGDLTAICKDGKRIDLTREKK